jgi:hypothetical protein
MRCRVAESAIGGADIARRRRDPGRYGRPLRYDVVTKAPGSPAFDVSCWRRAGHAITDGRNTLSGFFVRFRRESRAMKGADLAEKWYLALIDGNGRR